MTEDLTLNYASVDSCLSSQCACLLDSNSFKRRSGHLSPEIDLFLGHSPLALWEQQVAGFYTNLFYALELHLVMVKNNNNNKLRCASLSRDLLPAHPSKLICVCVCRWVIFCPVDIYIHAGGL